MNPNQDTSHLSDQRARNISTDPSFKIPNQITLCESLIFSGIKPEDAFQEAKKRIVYPQKKDSE